MDTDEKIVAESVIAEYRLALADAQLALAMANGRAKAKDRIISELMEQSTSEPSPPKPSPPKPVPPPAR